MRSTYLLRQAVQLSSIDVTCASATSTPIVFIHGLFGSSTNFRSIIRDDRISGVRNAHSIDLRNHGTSPHSDDVSFESMSEDVVSFLDRHGYSKAHIVGHSLGGKVAMTAGLNFRERVASLTVVDIAPVQYGGSDNVQRSKSWNSIVNIVDTLKQIDLQRIKTRKEVDDLLFPVVPEDGVRNFLLQNLVRSKREDKSLDTFRWRVNIDGISEGLSSMSKFSPSASTPSDVQTIFIYGGASDYVTPVHQPEATRLFPLGKFHEVPGAGHMVHAEQPSEFIDIVTGFLSTVEEIILPKT